MDIFSKLSNISRIKRLELFHKLFSPGKQTRILDIGAEINPNGNRGVQLIDSFPWKNNITAVNLSKKHIDLINRYYPQVESVVADACKLPWPDNYFDIVYSNAVIEHVGRFQRQRKMAGEIMRVGKKWFVATPNRWYPFEFHLRLPFVSWIPYQNYHWVSRIVKYNHISNKYTFINKDKPDFRLMTAKELKRCFPGSKVIKHRITFMPETLITIGI